jgi:hypothetical protein
MKIDKVTITGADDSTNIGWMQELSKRFPFVEWGILVSHRNAGTPRFPDRKWVSWLVELCQFEPMQLSVHVCGKWVREICKGDWRGLWAAHDGLLQVAKRVQLNFHAHTHAMSSEFFTCANLYGQYHQLIFQLDGVNDDLMNRARAARIDAVPLFDRSGGIGKVPDVWPQQTEGVYSGYAGGLGPENLKEELERISQVTQPDGRIWIDMETRVRTEDDQALDMAAVERVLEHMAASGYLETATT